MYDETLPQRQQFPQFGAGVVRRCCGRVFWKACDEGERGNSLPQRQQFPRFGAGVVRRCCGRVFWKACDEGERGNRLPQRQHLPEFGAGVVSPMQSKCLLLYSANEHRAVGKKKGRPGNAGRPIV